MIQNWIIFFLLFAVFFLVIALVQSRRNNRTLSQKVIEYEGNQDLFPRDEYRINITGTQAN